MEAFQQSLPMDMRDMRPLPGVQPVVGDWLRCDDAYAHQMHARRELIKNKRDDVYRLHPCAHDAAHELLEHVEAQLPGLGYVRGRAGWLCPDGVHVDKSNAPLTDLGKLCQADFCLLQKDEALSAHVLTGAVLCFPASWMLSEKFNRPLDVIHRRVDEYDRDIARRVQRLFDGVKVGRPLWRFNRLWYADAALFQPRSVSAPRDLQAGGMPFLRCERQVILRLPETQAVVFAIHTYVLRRETVPRLD